MNKTEERRFGYSYYGMIEYCGGRIVIKPDFTKPTPFAVSYSHISLPIECYKDMDIQVHKEQYVIINAYWITGQWNEEFEVYDAKNYENKKGNNAQLILK